MLLKLMKLCYITWNRHEEASTERTQQEEEHHAENTETRREETPEKPEKQEEQEEGGPRRGTGAARAAAGKTHPSCCTLRPRTTPFSEGKSILGIIHGVVR